MTYSISIVNDILGGVSSEPIATYMNLSVNINRMKRYLNVIGYLLIVLSPLLTYLLTGPVTKSYCAYFEPKNGWCGLGEFYIVGLAVLISTALVGVSLVLIATRRIN